MMKKKLIVLFTNGASICVTKCGSKGAYVSTKDEEGYMVKVIKWKKLLILWVLVMDLQQACYWFNGRINFMEAVKRGTAIGAIQVISHWR